jgi:ferredoxin
LGVDPCFEADESVVSFFQDAVGDEQVAVVPPALAGHARTGVTNCPERALRIEE